MIDIFIHSRELTQTEDKMFEMLKNLLELIFSTLQMVQEGHQETLGQVTEDQTAVLRSGDTGEI